MRDIAAALQDANKPDDTSKPCPDNEEYRSSDLCAQWKAADAAEASAYWTQATFWLGIGGFCVGFLTLIAAGAAAKFAYDAAVHTQTGNEITLDAQRGWIGLRMEPQLSRPDSDGLYYRINYVVENLGGTAATHFNMRDGVFFEVEGETAQQFRERIWDEVRTWRRNSKAPADNVLLPSDSEISPSWATIETADIPVERIIDNIPVAEPIFVAAVFYRTVSKPNHIQTSWRAWWLNSIESNGEGLSCLRLDKRFESDRLHIVPKITMQHEQVLAEDEPKQ